jgi:hypothetical protein
VKSHISDLLSSGTLPKSYILSEAKLRNTANKTPKIYTTPRKSLLNKDDSVKKHININGDNRKNKKEKVPKFKSMS